MNKAFQLKKTFSIDSNDYYRQSTNVRLYDSREKADAIMRLEFEAELNDFIDTYGEEELKVIQEENKCEVSLADCHDEDFVAWEITESEIQ